MDTVVNFKERILESYYRFMLLSFYVFLFFVLSFGRSFSILHINIAPVPFFITDIFLLSNILFLFYKFRDLSALPRVFFKFLLIFFAIGCLYLFTGLLRLNLFALRDVTISLYILFLPIAFIHLNSLNRFKWFIIVIILSSIVNIYSRQCIFMDKFPSEIFHNFISAFKQFNSGLYIGISSSFILSFYEHIKNRWYKLLVLIILSLNIDMLILFCSSSLWVTTVVTFVFLFLILRKKLFKFILVCIPVFILVSLIFFYSCFKFMSVSPVTRILTEAKGISSILHNGSSFTDEPALIKAGSTSPNPTAKLKKMPGIMRNINTSKTKISLQEMNDIKWRIDTCNKVYKPVIDNYLVKHHIPLFYRLSPNSQSISEKIDNTGISGNPPAKVSVWDMDDVVLNNISWRFNIWKQTLQFTMSYPLFGRGFGVYPVYKIWQTRQYPKSAFIGSGIVPPHNDLITVFLKMGFLGLGLFLFLNIYVFVYALKYLNKCNLKVINSLLIALLGAFVFWHTLAALFDVIDSPPTSIFLWVIIGMIFAAIEIDKKSLLDKGSSKSTVHK